MAEQATNTQSKSYSSGDYQMMGSGFTSILSGFASLQAASIQARQFKIQNLFLGLQREQEKLKARENAVFLRGKFLNNIASANASFAGRGVETGSGIGRKTFIQSFKNLNRDLQANQLNSEASQIQLRLAVSQNTLSEKIARAEGIRQAGKSFAEGGSNLLTGFKGAGGGGGK